MSHSYYITWTAQKDAKQLPITHAEDTFFYLENGKRIDDLISTSFQTNFGHSAKRITDAISKQLTTLPIAAPKWTFEQKERVSRGLLDLMNLGGGKIFYTVSGAEAVENALKIARQMSKKKIVLARTKSYHGASLGALSITGDWRNAPHATVNEWTVRIPEPGEDPDLKKTREIILQTGPDKIAAFCLETISGTNGVIIPTQAWWDGIQKLAKEFGIFLIVDEVLVGFGRAGHTFAYQKYGIQPDMVTLSKGITGGYIPFGALWTSDKIAAHYETNVLCCGLTNYAHPLGLAALDGVLQTFKDPSFKDRLQQNEKIFGDAIRTLSKLPNIKEVRIAGMIAAIEFKSGGILKLWDKFIEAGLFVLLKDNEIILAPPLTYKPENLKNAMERFGACCG